MDTDTYSDDEDISAPSLDEPVFTSSGDGMFAGSQYFTVAGGTFNNIMKIYQAAPTVPPDFRMIAMGDIDLQRELTVNRESGVIESRGERKCVRRVYSAKVYRGKSDLTVAVYQGDGAEEDWRRDREMYMSVRHPNIVQLLGGATHGNIHATVFHGDLVPFKQFLAPQSPIMTVYLYMCYSREWEGVYDYFKSMWQTALDSKRCTFWIRNSTGRLSVDPVGSDTDFFLSSFALILPTSDRTSPATLSGPPNAHSVATSSGPPNTGDLVIESLGLRQYHRICFIYLRQYSGCFIPTSSAVNAGAVIYWPSRHQYEDHTEIVFLEELDVYNHNGDWDHIWWIDAHGAADRTGNGWSRYRADDVFNTEVKVIVDHHPDETWLSQANYIFSSLQIKSNLEDYFLINRIVFKITIGGAGKDPPSGYLLLCPTEDFRPGGTSFRWPKSPAYWSLDSEGIEVLSTEEAAHLGFPPFQFATEIRGSSWDDSVYAGLRKFHRSKGFDPDSQDIALHLDEPLYRLSRDVTVDPPFAHGEL
ncbi:hypothetical protein B0H16DRAFT_513973 [Mycena metata]|uniref:Protein kinase domain-containing protein n=1 Tax=Mycena metata TaxID=1033252 RepID=A0AAD7H876_9AGAR|nr:hypothetical protein B0H16DRAFT_513973 [Mycena metata]